MTVRILQFRQRTRNYHFPVRHFSVLTLFCQILRYHLIPCKGFLTTIVSDRGDGRGHDFFFKFAGTCVSTDLRFQQTCCLVAYK